MPEGLKQRHDSWRRVYDTWSARKASLARNKTKQETKEKEQFRNSGPATGTKVTPTCRGSSNSQYDKRSEIATADWKQSN